LGNAVLHLSSFQLFSENICLNLPYSETLKISLAFS